MKNLFKMMGLALIAGAMFAACGGAGNVEIIANANDASLGSVTGGGKYAPGTEVTLTATAAEGAAFVDWNDGVKDNPRTIIVPAEGPVTYTANFQAAGTNVAMTGALTANWKATTCLGTDYSSYGLFGYGAFKNYDSAAEPYVQGYLPNVPGTVTFNGSGYNYMFYYENEDDVLVDGESTYPNWQPKSGEFTETITALDLTAGTISGSVNGTLFYLPDYENDINTTSTLNVSMVNSAWEASGKGLKKMGKLYTK